MRYNDGIYQYSDFQMCGKINRLKPGLLFNKLFKKRYLDILVTHAPPYKIHDKEDLCHRGFKCLNSFIYKYKPGYLIHGHIHLYGGDKQWKTVEGATTVINAYGCRIIEV
jgi:Icc-related predicted phosphoesterase